MQEGLVSGLKNDLPRNQKRCVQRNWEQLFPGMNSPGDALNTHNDM